MKYLSTLKYPNHTSQKYILNANNIIVITMTIIIGKERNNGKE